MKKLNTIVIIVGTLFLAAMFQRVEMFAHVSRTANDARPRIIRTIPEKVSPDTYVEVDGYWRMDDDTEEHLIFIQRGSEYRVESDSTGQADFNEFKFLRATVPEKLTSGACQLVVEIDGVRSEPFQIEVDTQIRPPVLTSVRPRWAQPGEGIVVEGLGFSGSDKVEIVDALGRVHEVNSSKSPDSAFFSLPANLADGPVSVRITEHRSDKKLPSNNLSFTVARGPAPLHILPQHLRNVAPGQALYLQTASWKPLEQATSVEVQLRQGQTSRTIQIRNLKDLRIEIPRDMTPGEIGIQNRVWRGPVASDWSDSVPYSIGDQPAFPLIYNLQIWDADSEVVFSQGGKVIAKTRVRLDGYARARVPKNLKSGNVVVERRSHRIVRDATKVPGPFGSCCPMGDPDGFLKLYSLAEWIFPEPENPRTVEVFPGDFVLLEGDFLATRKNELRVAIECPDRGENLVPSYVNSMRWISVKIPRRLSQRECKLSVKNIASRTTTLLPIGLRIK